MTSKITVFAIIFHLICIHPLFSQGNNEYLARVIPPSPTSSVFQRYGNHQPSLSSGTINIPIPLFEIETDNFKLPFSVQYNTAGINFMDQPCPLGYGWTFLPGLRVTRTILGRPDDRYPMLALNGNEDYETLKKGIISWQDCSYHQLSTNDLYDSQNDIFTVHLPSGNYTFLIKKVNSAYEVITLGNLLKITVLSSMSGFQVTDENGIIYLFGESQSGSTAYTEFSGDDAANTAWMLKEITLLNGSKINFTWKNVTLGYAPETATPVNLKDFKNISCASDNGSQPEIIDNGGMINYYTGTNSYLNVKMLEKVVFQTGEINISYKASNNPFMTKFEVKDKNGTLRKQVDFIYGEANAQQDHLLLKSLKINDELYKFSYNANRFTKNTTSLDYWGYYNGKNNTTLIPRMTLKAFDDYSCYNSVADVSREVGNADRSVVDEAMKAFMLIRIDYPTGGYAEFEYEPHHFTDKYPASTDAFGITPAAINKGGGLRVTKITTKTDANATATIKTYKYGTNENGMANVLNVPTLDTFVDEMWYLTHGVSACGTEKWATYRMLSINALSSYNKYIVNPTPIWYNTVTEYVNNDQKTEYKFEYQTDDTYYTLQFKLLKRPYFWSYFGLFQDGPHMTESTLFKKSGQSYTPAQRTTMTYDQISLPAPDYSPIYNTVVDRKIICESSNNNVLDITPEEMTNIYVLNNTPCIGTETVNFNVVRYEIMGKYFRLRNKEVTDFSAGGEVVQSEDYDYGDQNGYPSQLTKISKGTSEGTKKSITEYKFPYRYTDAIYITMKNKNMLAPIVEEITYKDLAETKRVRTNYTNATAVTSGIVRPLSVQSSVSGENLHTDVIFDKYDTYGNLLQQTPEGSPAISYLWSYNGQYAVAEAKNAAQSDIAYAGFEAEGKGNWTYSGSPYADNTAPAGKRAYNLGSGSVSVSNLSTAKEYVLSYWAKSTSAGAVSGGTASAVASSNGWTLYRRRVTGAAAVTLSGSVPVDEIRLCPIGALMTTYTYDPLVGVTSATDPAGRTTYYEYDGWGRLKAVREQDRYLVEGYDYQYRNQ